MPSETVFEGYVTCALWSSVDDDGYPLDDWAGIDDIAPEALETMRTDVAEFLAHVASEGIELPGSDGQTGHDFWLTRNGHGAGFWDRGYGAVGDALTKVAKSHGTCDLYVGDDGRIYVA